MTKAQAVKMLMLSVREAEKCNPNDGTGIMVNLYALKEVLRAIGRGEDTRIEWIKRVRPVCSPLYRNGDFVGYQIAWGTWGKTESVTRKTFNAAIDAAMKARRSERRPTRNKPESVKTLLGWMRPTVYEQISERRQGRKP